MSNEMTPFRPSSEAVGYPQPAPPPAAGRWGASKRDSGGASLGRYLAALRRYKWAFLGIVVVGLALGLVAIRFIEPEYTAQTTIWIEAGGGPEQQAMAGDYGPIRQQALVSSYAWEHLLRSFEVLEPVVRETGIYVRPADPADSVMFRTFAVAETSRPGKYRLRIDRSGTNWSLLDKDDNVLDSGPVGAPIGAPLGWQWQPGRGAVRPGRTVSFEVEGVRDVAGQLAEDLLPQLDLGGNFLSVRLSGKNPQQLAEILQALSDRFVEVATRLKRAKLDTLTTILEEQLRIAQDDLDATEVELENFRVNTILLPSERGSPVAPGVAETRDPALENYFQMRLDREDLDRERDALTRVLQDAESGTISLEALQSVPAVATSQELTFALDSATAKRAQRRALLSRYTPEHPDVRQVEQDLSVLEQQTIPSLVSSLLRDIEARDNSLQSSIASAGAELRSIPERGMAEARLERRATIQRTLYTDLKGRYENARLAAVSSVPDVSVLDRAKPPTEPSSDKRPQILSIALLASIGLGVLGVIVLDRSDKRLRFPEEVTDALGLTILGTVPHLHRRRDGNLTDENAEQVIESLRAIRLGIMHAYSGSGSLVLSVTSPGIGDGKSFVTSNLALAFTELGYSTLLIDGDVRRGCLHKLVGGSRRPGLTDLLKGDVTLDDALRETRLPGLSLIPCGTRMARGPELLAKPEFKDLLGELRGRFDVILIDCPPVGAAVDPLVIGTLTGNMIFVLRNGMTDKDFAEAKLTALDRLPIRLLGAVLNDVASTGVYRYYSYIPGYGTTDETDGAEPVALPVAMHPDTKA